MEWLVAQALELDGRLVGGLVPGRAYARIDGIQLHRQAAGELTEKIAETRTPGPAGRSQVRPVRVGHRHATRVTNDTVLSDVSRTVPPWLPVEWISGSPSA